MITTEVENKNNNTDRIWTRVALIAGIFALLMGTLLIANYLQLKKADPVNMTVITGLVEKLYENPADSVLRTEIRTLDLLSRKAYFTSTWQIKTGGYFLLAAVALMVISFQIIEYRKKINPVVSTDPIDEIFEQRQKARKWIVIGGSLFLMVAVVFGVLSSNDLAGKFTALSSGKTIEPTEESPVVTMDASVSTPVQVADVAVSADNSAAVVTPAAGTATTGDNYPNFRGEGGRGSVEKRYPCKLGRCIRNKYSLENGNSSARE
jgi:outer membrane protein assembly factor BamB